MIYEIIVTKSAEKALLKIPKNYCAKIIETIDHLAHDPRPFGYIKLKGADDLYRIRVGTYRIIYSIDDNILTIKVIKIGHRRDIYD